TTRAPVPRRSTAGPAAPPTTAAAPSPAGPRTYAGSVVRTTPDRSFGNVQVQITVLDGRVTDVTTLEMPEDTPESVRRTDDVNRAWSGPQGDAVRAANTGADLDTVSGATSTCNAYETSLQAALDQAGLR
ncbi:FMN-binding protein, partial [Micromonospora echinofusca]|uniref:FMN-binding protein n=1 Tax=Micromonospora echinofusca TaxID=47858 RepID=UPI001AD749DF